MIVTADTIRNAFALSRATAFRRFAALAAEVERGARPGATITTIPVTRGQGARGTTRAVILPDDDAPTQDTAT